jgi:hypothetical protein
LTAADVGVGSSAPAARFAWYGAAPLFGAAVAVVVAQRSGLLRGLWLGLVSAAGVAVGEILGVTIFLFIHGTGT